MKIHNRDRYKKYSYCPKCDILVPSIKTIFDEYGYMVAVRQPREYPRVYDDKGNTYDVQTLVPIKQINRRGLDGTLFEEIREFRVNVFCPECGKQCRTVPYSKTGAKNHYIASWRGKGRPKGRKNEKIRTEAEIAQSNYNEKQYFEQIRRKMNLNREAIIDTPDENLTQVERIMKHDPYYWRILSRKIKEQIIEDSKQDNLTPTRKETQRGSRFMSNYYAEDKDSKHDKFDIKSFREDMFRQWQEHNRRLEHIKNEKEKEGY